MPYDLTIYQGAAAWSSPAGPANNDKTTVVWASVRECPPTSNNPGVGNLMPPGDDEFDRGPRTPPEPTVSGYDRDLARAEQDRGSYGLVSAAYSIVRAFQELFRQIRRR